MNNRMEAVQGDITRMKVDAIVNAANSSLLGGGGVDGAIHRAAGPELVAECATLGGCATGEAKITRGCHLPAKYVIHTVGPVWHGGTHDPSTSSGTFVEEKLLADCYRNSLRIAAERGLKTVAFPAISTGVYRFPPERACRIAVDTAREFLAEHPAVEKVSFVCFDTLTFGLYKKAIA